MESTESREGASLAELDNDAESVQQSGSRSSNNLAAPVEEAPLGSPNPQPLPSSSSSSSAPVQPDLTVVAELANLREQVEALTLQLARAGLGPEAVAVGGEAPIGQEEDDELEDREVEVAHEVDAAELDDANAGGHAVDNNPNRRVPCRLVGCDKTLASIKSRDNHEETTHSRVKPYRCNLRTTADPMLDCNSFFKLENHVKTHLMKIHQAQEIRLGQEYLLLHDRVDERYEEWQRNLREAGFP